MGTIAARRIAQRFFEDDIHDGEIDYHRTDDETLEFDSPAELVEAMRRDGVRFDETGHNWAADPDGSQIIDYGTGEREEISWHFFPTTSIVTQIFIIAFVDAVMDVRRNEYGGYTTRWKAPRNGIIEQAIVRQRARA